MDIKKALPNTDKNVTEAPVDSCELNLSADKQWLRLIVSGKQVATFHVNYVNKVLGNTSASTSPKSKIRKTSENSISM